MSDHLTPEQLDAIKARDSRFAILGKSIAIEAELRDSEVVKAILAATADDAYQAMEQLADTSPEDKVRITDLLVNVRTFVYIRRVLGRVKAQGIAAEQAIRAEDEVAERE